MAVLNIHERALPVPVAEAGALIDTLAGDDDLLWPAGRWPAMRLDGPLEVGARGGHGPVRYRVIAAVPSRWVRFSFTRPVGFHGFHEFAVFDATGGSTLRHTLAMRTRGLARLQWPLLYRPLHDALLEDCLDLAERRLAGRTSYPARWSPTVRMLRALASAGLR
ncbi:SRPBCC family protein [Streptomyces meridianus]|uniref:SRPBCC family protein n=1 Tax=Streptomyces meridianus TaxID=2938945 RepID=A0ABT0X317_9ACTN|nr:SRPBCC family protein [Streptomyces meridianus]MCM2576924.1 SRPBCC family protein [Streptomyces meridianus]